MGLVPWCFLQFLGVPVSSLVFQGPLKVFLEVCSKVSISVPVSTNVFQEL